MIEIITLIVLLGKIADMARRRGRSPALFSILLLVCWFVGEAAGFVLGFVLSGARGTGEPNWLLIYGLALAGAAIGGALAFLIARAIGPVDGVWRELTSLPVRRSRLWGAVAGGVGGGIIGAAVVALMYGGKQFENNLPIIVQGFLAVGLLGALLGLVSGVQKG
jgi:hypothetical protein